MQDSQNIKPFDWHRLLIGETPWWFSIEIVARACIIYTLLMVFMRLMGKRVAGQMSLSEMAVVVTLGAAVGVPMQVQDRGMLPALLILLVALVFQRGLSLGAYRSRRIEVISQGDVTVLLQDGRLFLDALRQAVLSRERLFSMLRTEGVEQLGQLRRIYFETSGSISVYKLRRARPGLSIMPTFDDDLRRKELAAKGFFACFNCGNVCESQAKPGDPCGYCHCPHWTEAMLEVSSVEEDDERKQLGAHDKGRESGPR